MKKNLLIELLEDSEKVSLYSPRFECVQTLQKIDIELKLLEKKKIIYISGTKMLGTLYFEIDD